MKNFMLMVSYAHASSLKKEIYDFAIVAIYVDNMNLIETHNIIQKIAEYLKREFEMKNLKKGK